MFSYKDENENGIPDKFENFAETVTSPIRQLYGDARDAGGFLLDQAAGATRDVSEGIGAGLEATGTGIGEGASAAGKGIESGAKGLSNTAMLLIAAAAIGGAYLVFRK